MCAAVKPSSRLRPPLHQSTAFVICRPVAPTLTPFCRLSPCRDDPHHLAGAGQHPPLCAAGPGAGIPGDVRGEAQGPGKLAAAQLSASCSVSRWCGHPAQGLLVCVCSKRRCSKHVGHGSKRPVCSSQCLLLCPAAAEVLLISRACSLAVLCRRTWRSSWPPSPASMPSACSQTPVGQPSCVLLVGMNWLQLLTRAAAGLVPAAHGACLMVWAAASAAEHPNMACHDLPSGLLRLKRIEACAFPH